MQRNMHICRQICIFYARICTLGANVSFAYMHVHIVTALVINNENSLVWFSKQKQKIPDIFQAIFKLQVFQISMHPDRTTEHVLLHCPHTQNTHDIHSL